MKTKECTVCKKDVPATKEFFHAQLKGKYGLRSICKSCQSIHNKSYRSTDAFKAKRREEMKRWRAENREKFLEISRRCYNKNAKRINEDKRIRYRLDEEYRKKVKEREKRYKESGRRYEVGSMPDQREKARIRSRERRKNPIKKQHDLKRNAIWREKNRERTRHLTRKKIENLEDCYVAHSMRLSVKNTPKELIELQKSIIKLKRELKKNNIKIR